MKPTFLVPAITLLAALAACGEGTDTPAPPIPTANLTAAPSAPSFRPVDDATEAEANPFSLVGMPSAQSVELASVGWPTRLDAERFALEVANFYTDVRPHLEDEEVLKKIGAPSMTRAVRTFMVQGKAVQQHLGARRHLDDTTPMWIRSKPIGSARTPQEVAVEVAGVVEVPELKTRTWLSLRIDVVRRDGGWRLADLSPVDHGPAGASAAGRPAHLSGPGWRELAAGRASLPPS